MEDQGGQGGQGGQGSREGLESRGKGSQGGFQGWGRERATVSKLSTGCRHPGLLFPQPTNSVFSGGGGAPGGATGRGGKRLEGGALVRGVALLSATDCTVVL